MNIILGTKGMVVCVMDGANDVVFTSSHPSTRHLLVASDDDGWCGLRHYSHTFRVVPTFKNRLVPCCSLAYRSIDRSRFDAVVGRRLVNNFAALWFTTFC